MIKPLLVFITGTVLGSFAPTPPSGTPAGLQQSRESPAVAVEREVKRMAAAHAETQSLWPGFDPLAIPLAVFDGERTYLFRHPDPPKGFTPVADAGPAARALEGRHEAVTANTNSEIGGVATATLIIDPERTDRSPASLAAVAIHEAFHVHQRARHPGWIGNEADLFVYPTDSPELLASRRLETRALRRALADQDAAGAACWARRALELRRQRYAGMDSAFAAYERGTELNEGLAAYVEMRAANLREVHWPPAEFGPTEVRLRAYATGPALALLLGRFKTGWEATFEADDRQTLDEALTTALGPGTVCAFEDAAIAEAERKARTDVNELASRRQERLAAFEGKSGWRVVVEAGDGEPLWPQGFDPLNVERVGAGRVLHTRYLRLGNGAGQIEVLNAESLTQGAGEHPLFQGIRRVVLTGLEKPDVGGAEGAVSLSAPGLRLEFTGADVTRGDKTVTVRLGAP